MLVETIKARITVAQKTEQEWNASSIVLLAGEIGVASDTQAIKVGDGKSLWKDLKSHRGAKGEKGDPLTFDDLTPEQVNQLKAADIDLTNYPTKEEVEQAIQNVDVSDQLAGKADVDHTHEIDDINGLQSSLDGKAGVYHTHDQYATKGDLTNYITTDQQDVTIASLEEGFGLELENLQSNLNSKANINHSHPISNITGLQSALNGKANTNHSHSEYALKSEVPKIERVTQLQYDRLSSKDSNTLYVVVG